MRHPSKGVLLAGGLIAAIVTAGFFHADSNPSACRPPAPLSVAGTGEEEPARDHFPVAKSAPAPRGLLALTTAPGYRRAADLSLRVDDCTKAEDLLETKLQE